MKERLRRAKALIGIGADALYDARRFFRHSQSGRRALSDQQLRARMLAKAHSIEKGLSMPSVRPFFGKDALQELCARMTEYDDRQLDRNDPVYSKGRHVVSAYLAFHEAVGQPLPAEFSYIRDWASDTISPERGGAIDKTADQVKSAARGDFRALAQSRHSVRTFSGDPVDRADLQRAIELAQRSPSVCNRQSCKVYVIENEAVLTATLEIQGGNRGFGQEVCRVLVVTSALPAFRDSKERNQGFVDGGLFSMSLMYALHYEGLGCCPLNWSAGREKDKRLRQLLGIPDDELVIVLLGVGHLKDEFRVASSPRRSASEIVTWIDRAA